MSNKNIKKIQILAQGIIQLIHSSRDRAEYGKQLVRNLSKELEPLCGSGYSYRQLYNMFPNTNALSSQLNWSQGGDCGKD